MSKNLRFAIPGQRICHSFLLDGFQMLAQGLDFIRGFFETILESGILRRHALGVGHERFNGAAQRIQVFRVGHGAEVRFQGFAVGRRPVSGFAHEAEYGIDGLFDLLTRLMHGSAGIRRTDVLRGDRRVLILGKRLIVRQDQFDRRIQFGIASAGIGVPDFEIPRRYRNILFLHESQCRIGIFFSLKRAVDMLHIRNRVG